MHVLAALGDQSRPLSELVAEYSRYVASGEINSTVTDARAATAAVRAWAQAWGLEAGQDVAFDELDGMTVTHKGDPMWWFNLRASNTEPVLSIVRGEAMPKREETLTGQNRSVGGAAAAIPPRLEPWLREILRCPQCRSTLTDGSGPDGPELQCTNAQCRRAYRIEDGIPVLLVDESRSLEN